MSTPSLYTDGTITVTNGSTAFAGTGTAWSTQLKRGTQINIAGVVGVVDAITSDSAGTFKATWPGATVANAGYVAETWNDGADIADAIHQLMERLIGKGLGVVAPADPDAPDYSDNDLVYDRLTGALSIKDMGVLVEIARLPRGHLSAMTLANNGSDAVNDIDIVAGVCRDSTDTANLVGAALTKRLDAAWAVGSGAGGRMSAAAIANGVYYVHAIKRLDTGVVDYGFDVSPTAPTLPANYTLFRRIGAIVRAGGTILPFRQSDDICRFTTPVPDVATAVQGTASISRTLSVPPGMRALIRAYGSNAAAWSMLLRPLTETDAAPSTATGLVSLSGAAGVGASGEFDIPVDANSQIGSRASAAATTLNIVTRGFVDTRGRTA